MQFLSATISPEVDLVSAPTTTPPSKTAPQIVVPVLVVLGVAKPLFAKKAFLKLKESLICSINPWPFYYLTSSLKYLNKPFHVVELEPGASRTDIKCRCHDG